MNTKKYICYLLVLGLLPLNLFSQERKQEEIGTDGSRRLAQATTPPPQATKVTEGQITETKLHRLTEEDSPWKLAFYGFVKADYIYASDAVVSYSREMLQAPNQAKRQVQRDDAQSRQNIQLHDTRLGFKSKFKDKVNGIIELDFINFDQSSPNVNLRPRLRQAYIEWEATKQLQFFAGQKWDIFSPLNPDTYNIINSAFYLGNLGWMREQMGVAYQPNSELRLTAAVGNTAVNVNPNPTFVERRNQPTLAGQIKWTPDKENTVYLSAITVNHTYHNPDSSPIPAGTTRSLYYDGSPESFAMGSQIGKSSRINRASSGISIGSEHKPEGSKFRMKWEGNWGRNVDDINTLGIGGASRTTAGNRFEASQAGIFTQSSADGLLNPMNAAGLRAYNRNRTEIVSIEEIGGWMSMNYKFDPKWDLGIFLGITQVRNTQDLAPATVPVTGAGVPAGTTALRDFSRDQPDAPVWGAALLGRIRENGTLGYHLTYQAETGLRIFFQHEWIQTFYQDAQRSKGLLAHIRSVDLDTGRITLQNVNFPHLTASERATAHIIRIGTMYNF